MKSHIRIGNAGGFWGDDLGALRRQLEGGQLDYISTDYLAEITMSILRKQQLRNPRLGYVADFVEQIIDVAPLLKEKNVRMIANAGGINPVECGRRILEELRKRNQTLSIAIVEGDNLMDSLNDIYPQQCDFKNMDTGKSYNEIKNKVQSANAYLGVLPLLKALESGAQLIIAGRVTDTSITMAPMIHEFGWSVTDWDKLAAGLIAGHMIECGAQVTGGNYTDWHKVKSWENFGYPIVEVYPDGTFFLTKHENTGGLVNTDTLKEQLLYEMGDPSSYISPDVVVDFRTVKLEQAGDNRVKVSGVKGRPSTPYFKVSMAYEDGFKATGSIIISGGHALDKARIFAETFWKRVGATFEKTNTEYIGYDSCHGSMAYDNDPNEILLRFGVFDYDEKKIDAFGKAIAPLILSGPQGVAVTGGRPRPQQVMTYWPTLIRKELVKARVKTMAADGSISAEYDIPSLTGGEKEFRSSGSHRQESTGKGTPMALLPDATENVRFSRIALARSGDKGDMANVGVIARSGRAYEFMKRYLTADVVKHMFSSLCKGTVIRYELDDLQCLNFLLDESLDGGGTKSLMIDAQGKTYAAALLNQKVRIPLAVLEG